MMKFNSLHEARAFFDEMHTDYDNIKAGESYNMKAFDIAICSWGSYEYKKVIAHESGNFFIIGGDTFIDEGHLVGDYPPLPEKLQQDLIKAVNKGFVPYAVLAAVYEYRYHAHEGDIYQLFPGIMEQFNRMIALLM